MHCRDYVADKVGYAPRFTDHDPMARDLHQHFVDAPWPSHGPVGTGAVSNARAYLVFGNFQWSLRYKLEGYSPHWKTAFDE